MLYEVPPLAASPESARLCRLRTLLGAAEMLKLGITAVHDDAFFNPVPTPETIDAVMQAYADAGIRASVSLDQPNVVEFDKYPFLQGPAARRSAPRTWNARRARAMPNCWRFTTISSSAGMAPPKVRLRCSVSCSAPQRVTIPYFEALTALVRQA